MSSRKSKKPELEKCVDCGCGTFYRLGGDPHGVPICYVCEYKRQIGHAEIEAACRKTMDDEDAAGKKGALY